jgi:hypothetical protein
MSLQHKLDRIAHERNVLALLHDLALAGLREGDAVQHAMTGDAGRLRIDREDDPPRVLVVTDKGTSETYSASCWRPA